jgi:hypothetical protein
VDDPAAFQKFEHQVEAWVAEVAGVRRERVTPATTLNAQLGLDAEQGARLLEMLATRTGAAVTDFPVARYFVAGSAGLVKWIDKVLGRPEHMGEPLSVRALSEYLWRNGGRLGGQ